MHLRGSPLGARREGCWSTTETAHSNPSKVASKPMYTCDFPRAEVEAMGIEFEEKYLLCLRYSGAEFNVVKAYPKIAHMIGRGKMPVC